MRVIKGTRRSGKTTKCLERVLILLLEGKDVMFVTLCPFYKEVARQFEQELIARNITYLKSNGVEFKLNKNSILFISHGQLADFSHNSRGSTRKYAIVVDELTLLNFNGSYIDTVSIGEYEDG